MPTTMVSIVFASVALFPVHFVLTAKAEQPRGNALEQLRATDFTVPDKVDFAVVSAVQDYDEIVKELMRRFADSELPVSSRVRTAWALGRCRAYQAASLLLEHIQLEAVDFDPKIRIARWGKYPAAEALVAIGAPLCIL